MTLIIESHEQCKKCFHFQVCSSVLKNDLLIREKMMGEKNPKCKMFARAVHGRWRQKILVGGFAEEWGYVCSECGCTVSDRSNLGIGRYASKNQRLNYCPNCGANMMDGDGD